MALREEDRRGKRVLVIDIGYRKPDGSWARYRRDSEAATKTAAREEERRIKDRIAKTGSPFEAPPQEVNAAAKPIVTFGDIVEQYRTSYMVTDLKVTTRRGYGLVLDSVLLPRLKDKPVDEVDGEAASSVDLALTKEKLAKSTRNNVQIVLRSVLRFAVQRKELAAIPLGLPRLKQPEPSILEIPTDAQVVEILKLSCPTQRRAFGPIARPLAALLGDVEYGPRDGHVAVTAEDEPWGQYGLDQAFERVRDRASPAGPCTRSGTTPSRRGFAGAFRSTSSRGRPGTGTSPRRSTTSTS